MKKGKFAVQMMMVKGKVAELGVYETMRQIHELGYRAVEVSQIPMTAENVAEFKRAAQDFDIKIAAMSATIESKPGSNGDNLTEHFQKIVDDCKALDCTYLRLGMLPINILGDKSKIMDFIHQLEAMARRLDEYGIQFYYHNHHVEFQKYDGEYLLDLIKNNTSKLGFEIDVHWVARAGVNPVEVLKQYEGRIGLLHIKDFRVGTINLEGITDRASYQQKVHNNIEFAEIGEGNLDMKTIIDAGLAYGSEYFIIEQDNTYGKDPFDCLKLSADNLREMGYADWF
jgi:sugar phosphate isomerase/epimerase